MEVLPTLFSALSVGLHFMWVSEVRVVRHYATRKGTRMFDMIQTWREWIVNAVALRRAVPILIPRRSGGGWVERSRSNFFLSPTPNSCDCGFESSAPCQF